MSADVVRVARRPGRPRKAAEGVPVPVPAARAEAPPDERSPRKAALKKWKHGAPAQGREEAATPTQKKITRRSKPNFEESNTAQESASELEAAGIGKKLSKTSGAAPTAPTSESKILGEAARRKSKKRTDTVSEKRLSRIVVPSSLPTEGSSTSAQDLNTATSELEIPARPPTAQIQGDTISAESSLQPESADLADDRSLVVERPEFAADSGSPPVPKDASSITSGSPSLISSTSKILQALSSQTSPSDVVNPTAPEEAPALPSSNIMVNGQSQPTQHQNPLRRPKVLDPQAIKERNSRSAAPPRPTDIRKSPQYKAAARKWTSTIVALPILIYTSYILYERAFGGQRPKRLVREEVSSAPNVRGEPN